MSVNVTVNSIASLPMFARVTGVVVNSACACITASFVVVDMFIFNAPPPRELEAALEEAIS